MLIMDNVLIELLVVIRFVADSTDIFLIRGKKMALMILISEEPPSRGKT